MAIVEAFETDQGKYEVTFDIPVGSRIEYNIGSIRIKFGDLAFPKYAAFKFQYWGMGQCGHLMLYDLYCNIDDEKLYDWIFSRFCELSDGYFSAAGMVSFNTYYTQGNRLRGLVSYLLSRPNCKPIHTWRNQAHGPFSQMAIYVWHRNIKGVPDSWGIPTDIVIPQ